MTIQQAIQSGKSQLKVIYDEGESAAIMDLLMENITGIEKNDLFRNKLKRLNEEEISKLNSHLERLEQHEPLQYVLNESWFCGLKFYVDKNVLIPRPETEELVEWVIANCKFPIDRLNILDIGSGSGCIPITLKRRIRKASVESCDISSEAIKVAKQNAALLGADVKFTELNFLERSNWKNFAKYDIIISNPPYIPISEKQNMPSHVVDHEPAEALFVPEDDALVFYKAIAAFAHEHLNENGNIYLELHENLGKQVQDLFNAAGYQTELKKDMSGKERMLRAGF